MGFAAFAWVCVLIMMERLLSSCTRSVFINSHSYTFIASVTKEVVTHGAGYNARKRSSPSIF